MLHRTPLHQQHILGHGDLATIDLLEHCSLQDPPVQPVSKSFLEDEACSCTLAWADCKVDAYYDLVMDRKDLGTI